MEGPLELRRSVLKVLDVVDEQFAVAGSRVGVGGGAEHPLFNRAPQRVVAMAEVVATAVLAVDGLAGDIGQRPALARFHAGLVDAVAEHVVVVAHDHATEGVDDLALVPADTSGQKCCNNSGSTISSVCPSTQSTLSRPCKSVIRIRRCANSVRSDGKSLPETCLVTEKVSLSSNIVIVAGLTAVNTSGEWAVRMY